MTVERECTLLHATCVAFGDAGVIILGKPGSGKSDLALRLIDQTGFGCGNQPVSAALVSDDQVVVERHKKQLVATAPDTLRGLLEVRGLGIIEVQNCVARAPLHLAVCLTDRDSVERMPDFHNQFFGILGIRLPELRLSPWDASAPAKIRVAINALRLKVPVAKFPD